MHTKWCRLQILARSSASHRIFTCTQIGGVDIVTRPIGPYCLIRPLVLVKASEGERLTSGSCEVGGGRCGGHLDAELKGQIQWTSSSSARLVNLEQGLPADPAVQGVELER